MTDDQRDETETRETGVLLPPLTLEQRRDVEIVAHALMQMATYDTAEHPLTEEDAKAIAERTLRPRWADERLVRERMHLKVHDAAGACEAYYHRGSANLGMTTCGCGQVPIRKREPSTVTDLHDRLEAVLDDWDKDRILTNIETMFMDWLREQAERASDLILAAGSNTMGKYTVLALADKIERGEA